MNNHLTFRLLMFVALGLVSCQETYPPLAVREEIVIPYALVSVTQPGSATEATVEVKIPNVGTEDFQIDLQTQAGLNVPLQAGTTEVVANFKLRSYSASQLVSGEKYTVRLTYRDTRNNEITVNRDFTAHEPNAWTKLPHAPIFGGDYTGAAVLSPFFQSRIAVYQYFDEASWNVLKYSGDWESTKSINPQPRHAAVIFELPYPGNSDPIFLGFGYLVNEKSPDKRSYLPDLWTVGSHFSLGRNSFQVFHGFGSMKSTVKFFATTEEVFVLKENDPGTMYSMNYKWDEKGVQPFPEKTGLLATFSIDSLGYVINQIPGQPAHLYAYDTKRDQWGRRADFPGEIRTEGTGFSTRGKGYFGLGMNKNNEGLRDIWEYDPGKNAWKYHSEYPGQGHRLLIALSDKNKAYLGWGYENRPVAGTLARQQVGCTDFWEFFP